MSIGRLIVILAAGLLFNYPLCAQILVGPVAGGHLGWVSFQNKDTPYNTKPYVNFHAGASVSIKMQKRVFLETSLLYLNREKTLTSSEDRSFRNEMTNHFIDMPILFTKEIKVKVGKARYFNWYLGAGPNISYWLGGKGELAANDLDENFINPPSYTLPYKVTFNKKAEDVQLGDLNVVNPNRIQLGLNFSWGIVFEPINFNRVMFTTRYTLGHSFYSQDADGDFGLAGKLFYFDDMQIRNNTLSASLAYFFDLKLETKNKGKSTSKISKKKKKR